MQHPKEQPGRKSVAKSPHLSLNPAPSHQKQACARLVLKPSISSVVRDASRNARSQEPTCKSPSQTSFGTAPNLQLTVNYRLVISKSASSLQLTIPVKSPHEAHHVLEPSTLASSSTAKPNNPSRPPSPPTKTRSAPLETSAKTCVSRSLPSSASASR